MYFIIALVSIYFEIPCYTLFFVTEDYNSPSCISLEEAQEGVAYDAINKSNRFL